ncbi:MAG: hypothetical protein Q4G71_09130 [Pseudomonadota bacterium]|nr:hypothetical protein [Pseudomonadota bacterium]
MALPLLMLAANVLAWLRWGTDLPFFDDWRAYDERNALSFSPARLFEAINNTITPVGLALDALAQRWLGGNPLPYQTLSMIGVLGGLLWLQWRLLCWVSASRGWTALCWVLCVFMLQSDTYWGAQNLAYHQALPLVALLGAAALNFTRSWADGWRLASVFVLGLISGWSYVSGAIGALVLAIGWLAIGYAWRDRLGAALGRRVRSGGWAMLVPGIVTSAMQIGLTRRAGVREQIMDVTWPSAPDFWYYMAGKIGRSSGHGFDQLMLEVAWVLVLVLVIVGAAVLSLRPRAARSAATRRHALFFLPLLAVVLAYLCLVSLGRAGFRDSGVQGAGAVFRFGYERFHFFWVTLLYPWVAAAWVLWWRRRVPHGWRQWAWPIGIGLALLVVALGRGVFDVSRAYRDVSEYRASEIRCFMRQLGSGHPIECPGYAMMGINDLTRAYGFAREIQASFVRYLPIVVRDAPASWLLRWPEQAGRGQLRWHNMKPAEGNAMAFESEGDPQILFDSDDNETFERCRMLEVRVRLRADSASFVQVFFVPTGTHGFAEEAALGEPVPGGGQSVERRFMLESARGFKPHLRIDPVDSGAFELQGLQALCRLSATQ